MKRIAILPGDGIGPEVIEAALGVLTALDAGLEFDGPHRIGFDCYRELGTPLPDSTLAAVRAADAALFGAVTTPPAIPNYHSPILGLRKQLELYANIRPCLSFPHESSRPGIDLVIVRENTEGLYSGVERIEDGGDTVICERIITRAASERIVRHACELARSRGDRLLTLVHKANVLRESDGLFRRVALVTAGEFPELEVEELLVDACAMRLIKDPEHFQTLVTTNLFGDILSDEASMLVGGLGLASSGNIGAQAAVFEPVHGSAPDIAGSGRANPLATILSAALMLEHLSLPSHAARLRAAVRHVLEAGRTTPDLGGTLATLEVARAVVDALRGDAL